MNEKPFHLQLLEARRRAGKTQTTTASDARIQRIRYLRLEKGYLIPTYEEAGKLAAVLDATLTGSFTKLDVRKLFCSACRRLDRDAYFPPSDRPAYKRIREAIRKRPALDEEISELRERADYRQLHAFVHRLSLGSRHEADLAIQLLRDEGAPGLMVPNMIAPLPFRLVNPLTGDDVSQRKMPCIHKPDGSFFFIQPTLLARRPYTVDLLVWTGQWEIWEVDGEAHDRSNDKERDRDLALPVRHILPEQLAAFGKWRRLSAK